MLYANRSMALDSLFLRPVMSLEVISICYFNGLFWFSWNGNCISAGLMYALSNTLIAFDPLIEVSAFSTLQTSMVSAGRVFD